MLASICRRRRFLLALRQISAGGDGGAGNRILPSPSTILLYIHYSSTVAEPNSEPCPTTVSYLVSCGVSPDTAAAAAARRFRVRDTGKADAVRNLLREYGLSDGEVTCAVRKRPKLLLSDPDRTLRPKLDFLLVSLGLRPRVVAIQPDLLACSLDRHLSPCVDFLRGILGTEDEVRLAVSLMPGALAASVDNKMRPVVEALRRHGLSEDSIAKLLRMHLGVLLIPVDRIAEAFGDMKELGVCITHSNFIHAFRVICRLKRETWQRKMALLRSFGVTEDVLIRAFRRQPAILFLSEETMKKKLRFFLDVLKLDLNSIMQKPLVLTVSLDKCVKPRCAVLSLLIREGKLEWKQKLLASLLYNTKHFSKKFVVKHESEVPGLVMAFEGKIEFQGFVDKELERFSS